MRPRHQFRFVFEIFYCWPQRAVPFAIAIVLRTRSPIRARVEDEESLDAKRDVRREPLGETLVRLARAVQTFAFPFAVEKRARRRPPRGTLISQSYELYFG